MKTQAEKIADQFDNDGMIFKKDDALLEDVLMQECNRKSIRNGIWGCFKKYIFDDESSIIIFNDCWDVGTSKDDDNFSSIGFPERNDEQE